MTTESRLDYAIRVLTVENRNKLFTSGPEVEGTELLCLRPNSAGYYMPTVAYVVRTTSKRITVDLFLDRSERVTVSRKALLWRDAA